MPPAATNGIMYDTPVISHWRTLVPTPTLRVPPPPDDGAGRGSGHRGRFRSAGLRGVLDRGDGRGEHAGPVVHGLLDADVDERLAGEPVLALDLEVGGEDHAVGGGDDVVGQRDGAGRALGLDLNIVTGGLAGLLEILGRHVGVRDARRA